MKKKNFKILNSEGEKNLTEMYKVSKFCKKNKQKRSKFLFLRI